MQGFRHSLELMYNGRSHRARVFRFVLLGFDVLTIGFFVVMSMVVFEPWMYAVDLAIVIVLIADFIARLIIAKRKARYLFQLTTVADMIVIVTLLAPLLLENLAFLRVVRALRLLRSYHVLRDLRTSHKFFARNEEILQSVFNLIVFVFVVTALVYVLQVRINDQINNYIDALYFTVTTLTTTGFGDITLHGSSGRLIAVLIMVFGISLFLRLVQTIFRPAKVHHDCPTCGLNRHDTDAVHCKHCGEVLNIETEGV